MPGKSSRIALGERLERVEELLASGVPSGKVETTLSSEYGITRRQVRKYIQRVYALREEQRVEDAPYRRENLLRKIERFYARCMAKEKFGPAAQILVLEARLSGAFTQHSSDREALLERIGPPPDDPAQALPYARKVLVAELYQTMANPTLDYERRLRIVSDLSAKLGMIFARSEFEETLGRMESLLDGRRHVVSGVKLVDAKSIARPPTARGGGRSRRPRAVPGPGPGPRPGEGPLDPPDGGGQVG